MYKVYYEGRLILISDEPDKTQKYGLFHKFNTSEELSRIIASFRNDESLASMNIYGADINDIWSAFTNQFKVVEAAGGLVRHTTNRYLFIERNGMLDLPKGHVERGETPEEGALREVAEECGISGHTIIEALPSTYHTYVAHGREELKRTYWFLMRYDGELVGSPQQEEGITKVNWYLPDEVIANRLRAWPSLSDIIDYSLTSR